MNLELALRLGATAALSAPRTGVFPLGDSATVGYSGASGADSAGGWRVQIRAPARFNGPYNDFGRHAGVNGDDFAEMAARFATDWSGHESQEIIVSGGPNNVLSGQNATTTAAGLASLLDTIYGIVSSSKVVRVLTQPYLEYTTAGRDAVLDEFDRRISQVVADDRAAGRRVYVHDVGDPIQSNVHLDGVDSGGAEHPIFGVYGPPGTGLGYGLMANRLDRYLVVPPPTTPLTGFGGLTLEAWYRADDVTGTQLNDKSGNSRHVTLFNSPPASAGINGQTRLVFNGSTQYGRSGSGWTIGQPTTIVFVSKLNSAVGSPALFDAATATARNLFQANTSGQIQMFAGSSFTDALVDQRTVLHAYMLNFNGTSSKLWLDGVPRRQSIGPGTQGLNGVTLGASAAASPSNFAAMDWYEMIVFSGTPTDEDVVHALTAGYLNPRYGLWPTLGQSTAW